MPKHYLLKAETGYYDSKNQDAGLGAPKAFNIIIKPAFDNWKFNFDLKFLGTGFRRVVIKQGDKEIINKLIFVFRGRVHFNLGQENALKADTQYQLTITRK